MTTSVDVSKYILGHASIYYRAPAVLTDWTNVGLTMDDAVARIGFANANASEALNGIDGSIRGLDYMRVVSAEIEFTLPELSAARLSLAIPGAVSTPTAVTAGANATTLAAASAVGDRNVKVVAVTGAGTTFVVGSWIRVDVTAGGLAEYRQATSVGTAGAGGSGITFRDPLLRAHASGVAFIDTLGDGKTEITPPLVRRQPMTVYNDWALVTQSPADWYEFLIFRAIAVSDEVELSYTDEGSTPAGIRVVLSARKDETNLTLPLVRLRAPAA